MIDGSVIFRQVRHDLFGSKDAQDASTLTYTWVADQFGHVTLGFIVTLLLSVIFSVAWAAIVVAVAIVVKEAYDYSVNWIGVRVRFLSTARTCC